MGFSKSIQHANTGIISSYWRIVQMGIDSLNGSGIVRLGGYPSQETRDDGFKPYDGRTFQLGPTEFQDVASSTGLELLHAIGADTSAWPEDVRSVLSDVTLFDLLGTAAYMTIKPMETQERGEPEFADAEDV